MQERVANTLRGGYQNRTDMDAQELRSMQAPLKEQYKDDPQSAVITLTASGKTGEGVTCLSLIHI